jgi:hypothetical protein
MESRCLRKAGAESEAQESPTLEDVDTGGKVTKVEEPTRLRKHPFRCPLGHHLIPRLVACVESVLS